MFDDDVLRLRRQIKTLDRRLERERPPDELAGTPLQVLATVEKAPDGIRPGELASELQMTSSNVAATLRTLEASGLVDRRPHPLDGRKAYVTLTGAGRDTVAGLRRNRYAWLSRAVGEALTEKERRVLFQAGDIMQRLAEWSPPAVEPVSSQTRRPSRRR
jgi:DNA-binding MarR family transcriptional regulator